MHLAATDGWVSMRRPEPSADAGAVLARPATAPTTAANLYVFGFRNVTGLTDAQVAQQRGQAQISAPQLVFDQEPRTTGSS